MLAQVVYITYTPLGKKWHLCTRRLAYILHELWLRGVFHVYTTLKPQPSDICSGSGHMHCKRPLASVWVVYTQNTPRNHDLYITYSMVYSLALEGSKSPAGTHAHTHIRMHTHTDTHTHTHTHTYIRTYVHTNAHKKYGPHFVTVQKSLLSTLQTCKLVLTIILDLGPWVRLLLFTHNHTCFFIHILRDALYKKSVNIHSSSCRYRLQVLNKWQAHL